MRLFWLALVAAAGCGRLGFDAGAPGGDAGPLVEVAPRVCETSRWPGATFATSDVDLAVAQTPLGAAVLWVPTAGGPTLGASIGADWQLAPGAGAVVKDGAWSSIASAYVDDMVVFAVTDGDVKLDRVGADFTGDVELTCPIGTHVGGPPLDARRPRPHLPGHARQRPDRDPAGRVAHRTRLHDRRRDEPVRRHVGGVGRQHCDHRVVDQRHLLRRRGHGYGDGRHAAAEPGSMRRAEPGIRRCVGTCWRSRGRPASRWCVARPRHSTRSTATVLAPAAAAPHVAFDGVHFGIELSRRERHARGRRPDARRTLPLGRADAALPRTTRTTS